MKLWHIGFLLLLTIILFGQYVFNPMVAGADTWFYINQICDKSPHITNDIVFNFIIEFFPCDFVFIKIWLASLFFIMLFFSAKIGELYDKDNGWLLALIIGFFTLFSLEYVVFENDSLGFTLFYIALFYALRAFKEHKGILSKDNLIAIGFIIFAGLCWKGIVYWLFAFAIISPIFIIPLIGVLGLYWQNLLWFLTADRGVQEQSMFIGIIYLGLTPFFLFGLNKVSKKEVLMCALMLIPCIFVQKLYILAIPFISIIALMSILSIKKYRDTIISTVIIFSIFMAAFFGMHTYQEFPTVEDFAVVQAAAGYTKDVQNSFGIGYVAIYNDLNVSKYGGTEGHDYNCSGYVLTHPWITDCNSCMVLNTSKNIILYKC